MNLQFVREVPVRIVIEASSARRGFLFFLAAGFHKEIDPLTGMSADLVLVDQWLSALCTDLEKSFFHAAMIKAAKNPKAELLDSSYVNSNGVFNHAFAEIMAIARLNLSEKAEKEGVTLKSLRFQEERAWAFAWDSKQPVEEMIFSQTLYLESFTKNEFDLLKVKFHWTRAQYCEADFYQESLKLLKEIQSQPPQNIHKKLNVLLGTKLDSGSFLKNIEVKHLGKNYSIIV